MSKNDEIKTEYVPRPSTEIDLIKLISNIKDEMEESETGHAPNENINSLLVTDYRSPIMLTPPRVKEKRNSLIGRIDRWKRIITNFTGNIF